MSTETTPPPAAETEPKTRNVLGTKQIVDLWAWCERNKDSLPTTPNTKLAQIAAAELEFAVTAANIANMLAEMHIEKRKPDAPPTVEERVEDLEKWRTGVMEALDSGRLGALTVRMAQREDENARLADAWRKHEEHIAKLLQDLLLMSNRLERLERLESERGPLPGLPPVGHPELVLPPAAAASQDE